MTQEVYHIPALLSETIGLLDVKPDGIYVDATYGGGGHSRAIADLLGSDGHLFAFDQDSDAIARAVPHDRITLVHANFRYMADFLRFYGVEGRVDGILADLGVSFHHFDDGARGFSFRSPEGSLDMRMNRGQTLTAADLLNNAPAEKLTEIFRLYGELKNAPRIAAAIVKARETAPFATIAQLTDTVTPLLQRGREKKELAPLFQALRIEVNDEMGALREFLGECAPVLRPGGRLAVITYQSLEDRMVKNLMRSGNIYGTTTTDIYGRTDTPWKLVSRKPVVPTDEEVERNPRSRSAKLRVAERI